MASNYGQATVDYRQSGLDYSGDGDTAVSVGVVAAVAAVSSVTVAGTALAVPAAVAGIGSVPAAVPVLPATVTAGHIAAVVSFPEVQRSLNYREAGTAYGQAATSYTGVNVADVNVHGDVGATSVAGVGAVPGPSLTIGSTLSVSAIAASAAVPVATVTANGDVAAVTVAGVGAVPTAQAGLSALALPSTVAGTGAVGSITNIRRYVGGTTDSLASLARGDVAYNPDSAANSLARFYGARAKGTNVWIASGAVTEVQPSDATTITRTLHGGHVGPDDLTVAESALLIAAGYRLDVEAA